MPSINAPSLQVVQACLGGVGGAPNGNFDSPPVIALAVVFSAIGTALLAFALAKLWQQHQRRGGSLADRSEFVPPPPPYSLDPPPPFPAVVANHVQATTQHGAYHDEVSERDEEEMELSELLRRRERERREVEALLRNSYFARLADCPNI